MRKEKKRYYTIGHSNLSIDKFIDLLTINNINLVADVRSIPGSNKFPQFNKENLIKSLKKVNINYIHIGKLGGYKKITKNIDTNINSYWKYNSFKNYANYANYAFANPDFQEGLKELLNLNKDLTIAIMCAEVLWWRCHRRIITDYLINKKFDVYHIINHNSVKKAEINKNAIINKNRINYQ